MRKVFAVALATAMVAGTIAGTMVVGAGEAEAGVTYDFVFRACPACGAPRDVNGDVIPGAFVNPLFENEFTFDSEAAARACDPVTGSGCPVADVILRNRDALIAASVSIGFDSGLGLGVADAAEWSGLAIAFGMMTPPPPVAFFAPIAPGVTVDQTGSVSSFDGVTPPPNGPPSLAPGTYNIGTIVWDTSAGAAGVSSIFAFLVDGLDGTGGVLPAASNNI